MLDTIIDNAMSIQRRLLDHFYHDLDQFAKDFKRILQVGKLVSP